MLRALVALTALTFVSHEWFTLRARITSELTRIGVVPPSLLAQQMLISGEDHRHARHAGFDLIAICRALWRRIAWRRVEGASTIEQQIVRVLTGRFERTLRRKAREILLASLVAKSFPKAVLPPLYLRIAYFGWQMNGYAAACQRLSLDPRFMTAAEAAGLVARLKYPEPHHPSRRRSDQIALRKKHLLHLWAFHSVDGTYRSLNAATIPDQPDSLRLPGEQLA